MNNDGEQRIIDVGTNNHLLKNKGRSLMMLFCNYKWTNTYIRWWRTLYAWLNYVKYYDNKNRTGFSIVLKEWDYFWQVGLLINTLTSDVIEMRMNKIFQHNEITKKQD